MHPPIFILSNYVPGIACITAGIIAAAVVITKLSKYRSLDAIPTVGSNGWLDSLRAGYTFQTNALEVVQEGYERYKSTPFKVADRYGWIVVMGGRQHVEEIRKASDEALSIRQAAVDLTQAKYTMGPEFTQSSYHTDIIRSDLTRNLANLYTDIRDEISVTFDEVLDLRGNGECRIQLRQWKSVPALSTIQKVVCRTTNRLFVGLPLCRDPDWLQINLRYTQYVVEGANAIRRFPGFLAPFVAHFMTDVPGCTKRAIKHLAPVIEERRKLQEEYGDDWPGKPNDLLTWLMDQAPEGAERTIRLLTIRILATNFAAIHTSSNSFHHALFFLAQNPQYIQPLREEVESIVEKEGWSKASLGKMRKIDSFVRESQRMVGMSAGSMTRKVVKDFTFSDGTFIPKGTTILAPSRCLHLDDEHYKNAHVFDPFRFSDMRDEEGQGTKHLFVSTSPEYLPFGHGKHACPGRFFAANELKTMLAHIVVSYDVKLEDNETQPKRISWGLAMAGDPTVKMMFRRRTG